MLAAFRHNPLLQQHKLSAGKQADASLPFSCLHKRIISILIYVMTRYVMTFYTDILR